MRVVGYIILLLLALYFLFVKPYLVARKIDIDLEGVSLSFEEGLSFRSFLLYLPLEHRTFYIFIGIASIKPWILQAGEFNLIEVSTAPPSDKPFDYDFGPITELAGKLNLKVDKLYISINYVPHGESITLFIPRTELSAGKAFSTDWTQVYWMHYTGIHQLEVFLHKARIEGKSFIVERANLRSSLYDFSLKGIWKGKEGNFTAEGYIKPIEGKHFLLEKINTKLSGNISYTSIKTDFSGFAESLDIKGRRNFRNLKINGQYIWKWRKESKLRAFVSDGITHANLDYSLKDRLVFLAFKGFPVESKLLGINQKLYALTNGELSIDLDKKSLKLQAYSPVADFEGQKIEGVSLKVDLNYMREPEGRLDLSTAQPYFLSVRGSFFGKDFTGNVSFLGYRLKREDLSALVSYNGSLRLQQGQIFSYGKGRIEGLLLRNIDLGSADYNLYLEGDSYKIDLNGKGYSLAGSGSLKERDFSGRLNFENMNLSYENFELKSLTGNVKINLQGERSHSSGMLEGNISRENLSSWSVISFDIEKRGEEIEGSFRGQLKDTKVFQLFYEKGSFEGKVKEGKIYTSFDLQDRLVGKGYYDYKNASYSFEGYVKHSQGELSIGSNFRLSGKERDLTFTTSGNGKYKGFSFPIIADFSMKGGRVEGLFKGFSLKEGIITLRIPDIKVYGNIEHGYIDTTPLFVSIGQETISKVEFQRGNYKGKKLSLRGSLHGVLEGWLEFYYDEGPRLFSEGVLDLGRLFSVVRSRVLADAEGKVSYKLSYTKGLNFTASANALTLRSRYLALPLSGSLDISFKNDRLSGFIKLSGNQRSSILANFTGDDKFAELRFESSQLPVLYRNEAFRASLFLSGRGIIRSDYKSVSVGGNFYTSGIVNLQEVKSKEGKPPEEYKRIRLDLSIDSSEPIRVNLPEGFVYADLSAKIKGSLYEPDYMMNTYLKGGTLKYFEREFFIRRGEITFTNKEHQMDLTIIAPTPDYSILIDLKGNPQYPKVIVRSEPPRDTREVLSTLVLGGAETEGLIPVGGALISQVPQISGLLKGAKGMTGLDIKVQVSPSVSPTGEVGINATVSKDITQRISVEHRQSTLRNPKETYTGGDVKLSPNTSIGGRLYSDRTQEVRVRIRKKFDF